MNPMLQLDEVTLARQERVIAQGVTIRVNPGETVAILGANGTGKSTLLATMAGCLQPQSGRVMLAGQPLQHYQTRALARVRAYIPQMQSMHLGWRVKDFIALGRYPHAANDWLPGRPADEQAVFQAAAATGVTDWLDRPLQNLSGGQRQRVYLAQILAQEAPLLLLDEPTTYLDWHGQITFMQTLNNVCATQGLTLVTVLHDLNLAIQFCRRVIVLAPERGIVADGPASNVLTPLFVRDVFGITVHRHTHPDSGHTFLIPAFESPADAMQPLVLHQSGLQDMPNAH